jgi:WD40 repeat protein
MRLNEIPISVGWMSTVLAGLVLVPSKVDGQEARHVLKHELAVTHIAVSSDGTLVASGHGQADKPGPIIIWDSKKGVQLRQLAGHDFVVAGLTFINKNRFLISAGFDKTLRTWDVGTGKEIAKVENLEYLTAMMPVDERTVATLQNASLVLWDISNPKNPMRRRNQHDFGTCSQFAFSSDGKLLVTGQNAGLSDMVPDRAPSVSIWEVSSGKLLRKLDVQQKNNLTSMAISFDNKTVALGYFFGGKATNLEIRDIETGKSVLGASDHRLPPRAFAFSPDGKFLASGDYGGALFIWDLRASAIRKKVVAAHSQSIQELAFCTSGEFLVSASFDQTVKIWAVADIVK